MKITILDIETTGIPPKNVKYEEDFMLFPHILSMAWKVILDGNESQTFEYIINQEGRLIPPEATKINGITQEMCDASKFNTFTVLLQFMMDAQGSDFIVGHNIYFDTSIIKANILRIIKINGKTPMDMFNKMTDILHKDKRIDTMRVCHKLFGGKWPTLVEAYTKLFDKAPDVSHAAGADVQTTTSILFKLISLGAVKLEKKEVVIMEEEI